MSLQVVKNEYEIKEVKIKESHSLICDISDELFNVEIIVNYKPKDRIIELVSFREFVSGFKRETVESLCFKIKQECDSILGINNSTVIISGKSKIHPDVSVQI